VIARIGIARALPEIARDRERRYCASDYPETLSAPDGGDDELGQLGVRVGVVESGSGGDLSARDAAHSCSHDLTDKGSVDTPEGACPGALVDQLTNPLRGGQRVLLIDLGCWAEVCNIVPEASATASR
jgi:hypothetical protein